MALLKLLTSAVSVGNTGNLGGGALGKPAMLFLTPPGWSIPVSTTDIVATMKTQLHNPKASRVYAIGGYAASFWDIEGDPATDVIETSNLTGAQIIVGPGTENKVFVFIAKGAGAAFAQSLNTFRNAGFGFMLVDSDGAYALIENLDANGLTTSYSGLPTVGMGGRSYRSATAQNVAKIVFGISYLSDVLINASLFQPALGLLNLKGLADVTLAIAPGATQTTTNIFVTLQTKYGQDVAAIAPSILVATDFLVTNATTNAVVTITAVTYIPPTTGQTVGQVRLTGAFTSGVTYNVTLQPAATLLTNGTPYYEASNVAAVPIP